MPQIEVRVPVKVTLFGEHAVVYNKPAIAATLPLYIRIEVKDLDKPIIIMESRGVSAPLRTAIHDRIAGITRGEPYEESVKKVFSYVVKAIEVCEETLGISRRGYSVVIDSALPIGVGLGTSAAVSVGVVTACLALNTDTDLLDSNVKKRIAYLAWQTEKRVQGAASPMDTHTTTFGGLLYIKPWIPLVEPIEAPCALPILVGYTPKLYTTAELVAHVKRLRERLGKVLDVVMDSIAMVVDEARKCIEACRLEELGELMNINHGFLSALGLVAPETDAILHALRRAGALGAKMSGAGGGGAFIALARSTRDIERLRAVAESLGATVVAQNIHRGGVEIVRQSR